MSTVFEGYERQYCELSAKLSKICTAAAALNGEQKKQNISDIKAGIDEAEALIRKMDLEARSLQPNIKGVLLAKLREYKSDLNNNKSELKKLVSGNMNPSARDMLLESGMADAMTVSADQRDRLMFSTERLNKSSDRIKDSRRTMLETEELGVSILQDLHSQRQSLLHAHDTDGPMSTIVEETSPDSTVKQVLEGLSQQLFPQEQDAEQTSPEKETLGNEEGKDKATNEENQETKEVDASKDKPSPTTSPKDLVSSPPRMDTTNENQVLATEVKTLPVNEETTPVRVDTAMSDAPNAGKKNDLNPEGAYSTTEGHHQPEVSQEGKAKSVEITSSADYERTTKTDDSLDDEDTSFPKSIPNICLPVEVLQGIKHLAPEDALNTLLSSHGAYIPTAADREKALQLEQAEHELRFRREVIDGDMLELLEREPTIYFNIKALFSKLQTPQIAEDLFLKVSQAETLLEQYAKNFHALRSSVQLRDTQLSIQQDHFKQATHYNEEAANIKAASAGAFLQVAACEDNISKWKAEIRELEAKIDQEEQMKEHFAAQAIEVPRSRIEELAHAGLQHYSDGLIASSEVDRLINESNVLQRKLDHTKEQYYHFRQANKSWTAAD